VLPSFSAFARLMTYTREYLENTCTLLKYTSPIFVSLNSCTDLTFTGNHRETVHFLPEYNDKSPCDTCSFVYVSIISVDVEHSLTEKEFVFHPWTVMG
jgi:hypothetical protein